MLIDELRKQQRYSNESYDETQHTFPQNSHDKEQGDLALFNQALSELPFEQREALCLQQEGFSIAEISDITHAQHETIKSRLRYAKQKLHQVLTHTENRGEN